MIPTNTNLVSSLQKMPAASSGDAKGIALSENASSGKDFEQVLTAELSTPVGETVESLATLLELHPDLQAQLPKDMLIQYVEGGGEDSQALEELLTQLTGEQVDLTENITENLNQVITLLDSKGVNTEALTHVPAMAAELHGVQQITPKTSDSLAKSETSTSLKDGNIIPKPQQENLSSTKPITQKHLDHGQGNNMPVASEEIDNTIKLAGAFEKATPSDDSFLKQFQQEFQQTLNMPKEGALTPSLSQAPATSAQVTNPLFVPASPDSPILVRTTQIAMPVGQGEWSQQLNEQVMMLSSQNAKSALIKLNPAELGPVEVHLKIVNDVATVHFGSHSSQVRDLIEQALPKLRDMMGEQGIQLADVDVRDNSQQQATKQQFSAQSDGQGQQGNGTANMPLVGNEVDGQDQLNQTVMTIRRGLVDYFA